MMPANPPANPFELSKSYSFAEAEPVARAVWEAQRCFHVDLDAAGEPFCIVIPPPNVTGALHLGHAFNNTLQDILTRFHRMRGFRTLWMPGTDHAGISTQAVVEKRLAMEGVRRADLGREKFVARVQAWKDEYEATIIAQLQAMGASCDFERTRFTMDPVCAAAVREAFFRLFRDGFIYRGKRLVNWDPVAQTALADDEVEMEEIDGSMHELRYPVIGGDGETAFVTVATTRPETMLGDTAVAINPRDPRAALFRGKRVMLPIVGREIPIVEDDYVVLPQALGGDPADPKSAFATGFLKVTPAHDPNDWEIGVRHGLQVVNVLAPDASISDRHGWSDVSDEAKVFVGLSREEARKRVVQWFKEHGALGSVKPYRHAVGHSERSHVPIEPYLSDQWYVRVTDDRMKGAALRAMADEQYDATIATSPRHGASDSRDVGDGSPLSRPAGEGGSAQRSAAETGEGGVATGALREVSRDGHVATPPSPAASRHPLPQDGRGDGDGQLRFFPARYAKTFQLWHENLRDWCISRQLWWGHRIPVWSTPFHGGFSPGFEEFQHQIKSFEAAGRVAVLSRPRPRLGEPSEESIYFICIRREGDREIIDALERHGFTQDPDVLDTWFSSALWPISTMGWPDPAAFPKDIPEGSKLLETFNPSTVLSTAREILTLWVSRMVMFNRYFRDGALPFANVFVHAVIQDGFGQKMSKSLGNGVDPRDIIHSHGADAMRFVLAQSSTNTQDVRMPVEMVDPVTGQTFAPKTFVDPAGYTVAEPIQGSPSDPARKLVSGYGAATGKAKPSAEMPLARNTSARFDLGRNFCNKLWNATRFALANLGPDDGAADAASARPVRLVDRWIVTRLHRTLHAVEDALADYQFASYAEALYDFVWRDFCDWYLEAIKPTVKSDATQRQVLRTVLNAVLRLLHPVVPHVTEALWPAVSGSGRPGLDGVRLAPNEILATAAWPDIACRVDDKSAAATFERAQSIIDAIRTLRGERQVNPKRKIALHAPAAVLEIVRDGEGVVETLAGLESADDVPGARPPGAIAMPFAGHECLLSGLAEEADPAAEKARLDKVIAELERSINGFRGKLDNAGYVAKAPPAVVEETRQKRSAAEAELAAAKAARAALA